MDYLEQICTTFLKDFAESVKPNDQLPVNMAGYNVFPEELQGEVITWCQQYLSEKNCPLPLLSPIIEIVKCKVEKMCKTDASSFGFDEKLGYFNPLKLMQRVISELNEVCLELQNNEKLIQLLNTMPSTTAYPKFAVSAVKNTRKKMEDRHIVLNDFNRLYSLEDKQPMSFYGIFDGHGGTTAACYCVANFHNFLSQNLKLSKRTDEALRETFLRTDKHYAEKSVQQCFSSGSCALCAVYKVKEKKLCVGWLGDSQALLVKKGRLWQIVQKHSPAYESERNRIEQLGGVVLNYNGIWRVQGQLAVARAIGPATYKPFVSNEPDICCIELDGEEDFLVLACDGLWDNLSEDEIAIAVYRQIKADPEKLELVTQKLVEIAKAAGSSDNITVIVIFLKNPTDIVDLTDCIQELKNVNNMETDAVDTTPNILTNNSDPPSSFSLENRILGELQLRNPEMVFAELNDSELSVNSEKKDLEKDEASGFSAEANLVVGDSGCEDSEDEWDFIKIDKESEKKPSNLRENQKQSPTVETTTNKMSSEILNNPFSDNMKESELMSAMQSAEPLTDDYHEKELVYNVDESEKNDENCNETSAESKLNPTAAEFVPRSPASPVQSLQNPLLLLDDLVVAQSPKPSTKNHDAVSALMEDISVPTECEFDAEVSARPHETEDLNDFIASQPENLNPKEAAQSDEKLEEDYIAISNGVTSVEQVSGASLMTFDRFNEPAAMQESFYEENRCEDLNKIQTLPQENDQLVEQFEHHNEGNCLIGNIMSSDDINDMMADVGQNLPVMQQDLLQGKDLMSQMEHSEVEQFKVKDVMQSQDLMLEMEASDIQRDMNRIEAVMEEQKHQFQMLHSEIGRFEQKEQELVNNQMQMVVEAVNEVELCQQFSMPSSDFDLNKALEQCDEKLSNIELCPVMGTTPLTTAAPSTTEIEAIKNEVNQLVTLVDEPPKQPEQNLLIDTTTAVAVETPKMEDKCETNELIQTEKVSENVLIEAIPDVIPKTIVKRAAAAPVSAEKPKVPAAKTTAAAKKPLGAKTTPVTNGVKGVAPKKTAAKATDVKKTTSSTLASSRTSTAKAPAATRSTLTSRTTATSSARTITSSASRTSTTTTTASRVATRPIATTKTTTTTTTTTATKTQEGPKPIRKPLSTSTASKTGEARVPISMRSAPRATTTTVDGKTTTASSRVGSAKTKVSTTTATTTAATKRPVSAPKTSVDAKVSSTRTTVASKTSVPNKKPITAATKKIEPKAVPSKNIIKKPATAAPPPPTSDVAVKLAETTNNGVVAAEIENATNN